MLGVFCHNKKRPLCFISSIQLDYMITVLKLSQCLYFSKTYNFFKFIFIFLFFGFTGCFIFQIILKKIFFDGNLLFSLAINIHAYFRLTSCMQFANKIEILFKEIRGTHNTILLQTFLKLLLILKINNAFYFDLIDIFVTFKANIVCSKHRLCEIVSKQIFIFFSFRYVP